ncbi:hypothetical protein HAX54_014381, partial [Datura stramonium]|nr:hypothetical protein [Datura stramonium]
EGTGHAPLDQGIGHEAQGESSIPLERLGVQEIEESGRDSATPAPYVPPAPKKSS